MTTSMSERSSVETGGRITCAWRVVSVTYMSIATQNSSSASAASSRAPPGVESTGLPATISSRGPGPRRRGDLVGQAGDRQLAVHLREPADALRVATVIAEADQPRELQHRADVERRVGEHRAAGASRLPVTALSTLISQWVSDPVGCWHTPTRPYATARSASANSRASRAIVSPSTPAAARPARAASARPGPRSRRPRRRGPRAGRAACGSRRTARGASRAAGRDRRRGDRDVLGREVRGLRAPRVHDHDGAAAGDDRAQAVARAGRRHQRAVRHRGVRAEHQHVVGAVDVRDREQREVAEHLGRRQVLRELVDRRRRVVVAGVQHMAQQQPGQHRHRVRRRIAEVGRDRVVAVLAAGPRAARRRPGRAPRPSRSLPTRRRPGAPVAAAGPGPCTDPPAPPPSGRCSRARSGPPRRR